MTCTEVDINFFSNCPHHKLTTSAADFFFYINLYKIWTIWSSYQFVLGTNQVGFEEQTSVTVNFCDRCITWHSVTGSFCHTTRDDFRFAPSQWDTSLQSNAVSHWLGANLESASNAVSHWLGANLESAMYNCNLCVQLVTELLVQGTTWCWERDKPLPVMVS